LFNINKLENSAEALKKLSMESDLLNESSMISNLKLIIFSSQTVE